ncbi:MAG: Na+/H+ antiporter subunit E [Desulfobacterales bacterium]|nr:Na+/H+ antiporter subunit E [Desulfobacterales bacterium]
MNAFNHASDSKTPSQPPPARPGPEKTASAPSHPKRFSARFFLTFFIMFGIWLVFSGRFDLFHLILGGVSCGIVALLSGDLLFPSRPGRSLPLVWARFIGYIPWLLYQIFLANLRVMYLVFHPRMMDLIDPQIIEFNSRLTGDVSRTTFANSITLTPGTITIDATAIGKFSVHCIDAKSGKPLPGEMEAKIAKIFEE